jgi:phenylalanyl-tRNA synthetase beta chain
MHASLHWLNALLEPAGLTAEEAERLLTFIGFPIESAKPLGPETNGDVLLDVEVTSNRGDCLSHVGLAREIAAASGRRLKLPAIPAPADLPLPSAKAAGAGVRLENRVTDGCPLFTLRVVRGVKVGPSPAWLVARLAAVGQRSINNVVDVTNYVQFELGNPSHVFDLAKMRPDASGTPTVVVRHAEKGEKLALLDGKVADLIPTDLVVADGQGATSLAGIMGGVASAVGPGTTDVLLEVATWAPGLVRKAARRLDLRTDASHRFERFVDPRTIAAASARAAALLVELAGGRLESEALCAGVAIAPKAPIAFRPDRCRALLGAGFSDDQIAGALAAQGVSAARGAGPVWPCTTPDHRPDLRIEEDLVEEVARTVGLDKVPVHDRVAVRVSPPQRSEAAEREAARTLTGLGFFEAVTFSFTSPAAAKGATPAGMKTLEVSDDRRAGEGVLRPSVLTGLLACRAKNQDARAAAPGTVRLYETASVFAQTASGHAERRNLALLIDAPIIPGAKAFDQRQGAVRVVRAAIATLAHAMHGAHADLAVTACGPAAPPPMPMLDADAAALVTLGGKPLGYFGLLSRAALAQAGLQHQVAVAELDAALLYSGFPPKASVSPLPAFPATDRDLSLIVDEGCTWARVEGCVKAAAPAHLESLAFVGVYRGKPLDDGKKSVTLRMVFRDPARTLRDEEVNPEVDRVVAEAKAKLNATLRLA